MRLGPTLDLESDAGFFGVVERFVLSEASDGLSLILGLVRSDGQDA
jgi:hypothetical protein